MSLFDCFLNCREESIRKASNKQALKLANDKHLLVSIVDKTRFLTFVSVGYYFVLVVGGALVAILFAPNLDSPVTNHYSDLAFILFLIVGIVIFETIRDNLKSDILALQNLSKNKYGADFSKKMK